MEQIISIAKCSNMNILSSWNNAPGNNDITGDINPCYKCKFHEVNEENKDLQCKTPLPFVSYIQY